ncbi:polysaccharide pyruvyl transferase family protein [Leptolyngbya sp. FACHB-261]|uniref:polysaccharide pyruvyl transferase family protein n=1 Tax=Leptolyngbya sp. FACHB-261 TaxID=2692806 RepID=UPI0016826F64|nr:polysaccharide pyruvyl transferase family protein [Leptolyngbya sp. FACHB-261]MBD2099524.1 polysaccharide pyruvyl transferase family protein [Leptolyngbya sp. FACHB-261]
MKIIVNNTVALNGGDAAILLSIIQLLRASFGHDTQFVIADSQPEVASQYYPDFVFRKLLYFQIQHYPEVKFTRRISQFANWSRLNFGAWCLGRNLTSLAKQVLTEAEFQAFTEYQSADLVVSTGGTYLVENYGLRPRIFDYQIALRLGKPLIFFTQSLGPFADQFNREALKPIFEQAALVLLRDQKSKNNLLELGVQNPNLHVNADAVFALADSAALEAAAAANASSSARLKVAISVREWQYFKKIDSTLGMQRYLQAFRDLSIHLVEKYGAEITYLSTCQGVPRYWTDDSKVGLEIFKMLPESVASSVTVNTEFHSPKDLIDILKGFDLVISTRMHMAILSLGSGVPVLPIAYEFKTQELFERLGHGHWVQDIEDVCTESLIQLTDKVLNALPESRQALFAGVAQERESALASGELVKRAYEQWQQKGG